MSTGTLQPGTNGAGEPVKPLYPAAGLGVELEVGTLVFENPIVSKRWNNRVSEADKARYRAGADNVKGLALTLYRHKKSQDKSPPDRVAHPEADDPGEAIPQPDDNYWDLTAEHGGTSSDDLKCFAELQGEYILNGKLLKVKEVERAEDGGYVESKLTRIADEIIAFQKNIALTREDGQDTKFEPFQYLTASLKGPLNELQSEIFRDVGRWRVEKALARPVAQVQVTTAMPIEYLSELPSALGMADFDIFKLFDLSVKEELLAKVTCSTSKLRNIVLLDMNYKVPANFLGFITLCSIYAYQAARINRFAGPKAVCSLVPRNDFNTLFAHVNGKAVMKENFQTDYKYSLARVIAINLGEHVSVLEGTFKWGNVKELSVSNWLEAIGKEQGKDRLTVTDGESGDGSIGRLGDLMESIQGQADKAVPIWEFRELGPATLNEWDGKQDWLKLGIAAVPLKKKLVELNNVFASLKHFKVEPVKGGTEPQKPVERNKALVPRLHI